MKKLFLLFAFLSVSGVCGMEEHVRSHQEQKELDNQLIAAAKSGNTSEVIVLIERGADVNVQKWPDLYTPLHRAALHGYAETVLALIERGANVHANESGVMPLHRAALSNNKEVVPVLIAHGADVHAKNMNGGTPLHTAVSSGCIEVVIVLIEQGANVNAEMPSCVTPLHLAAVNGYAEKAIALIERDADVDVKGFYGTPLHGAAHIKIVHVLLLVDRCKNKTEEEIKSSRSRIITLLLCLKNNVPSDLKKKILLCLPEDIFSADMLNVLLPITDREQIASLVCHCPRIWFVQAINRLSGEKRCEVIQEAVGYAIEQADERCKIKDGFNRTAYDLARTDELKRLLHADGHDEVRAAFIREQIEKEFSEEKSEDTERKSDKSEEE